MTNKQNKGISIWPSEIFHWYIGTEDQLQICNIAHSDMEYNTVITQIANIFASYNDDINGISFRIMTLEDGSVLFVLAG